VGHPFALRQGPDAAFETLYRRHVHDVYRYALAVLGSPADAEDVTQTTFLNAYRAFQRGERPRKPGNWLRTIAHNVCRQRFRQATRRPREVGIGGELMDDVQFEESEGPTAQDIARALRSLPFNQRASLVMRELEGLSQAEIAESLELSVSAVEALLFRARRALREQLEHSLTCGEAERAISRQLAGSVPRAERAALRAHLRECPECATFARQARGQRKALKKLAFAPLPSTLLNWSGGAATSAGLAASAAAPATGVGVKIATGLVITAVAVGAGDQSIRRLADPDKPPTRAVTVEHDQGAVPGRAGTTSAASSPATPRRAFAGTSSKLGHDGRTRPHERERRPHGAAKPTPKAPGGTVKPHKSRQHLSRQTGKGGSEKPAHRKGESAKGRAARERPASGAKPAPPLRLLARPVSKRERRGSNPRLSPH
jgi:RNA polymerase sigma-70 factor, ECF subfamily